MTAKKLRVLVLFGGRSGEHEVSLLSARSVLSQLDPQKYEVVPVGVTHDGRWLAGEDALAKFERGEPAGLSPVTFIPEPGNRTLYSWEPGKPPQSQQRIDLVFPLIHGTFGEDGTLQGLLELMEIPYVSCGVLASSAGMDKGIFKDVMRSQGIPVVDWLVVTGTQIAEDLQGVLDACEQLGPYPLFTKPANLGSSVGISKCRGRSDLVEGLMDAARYDRRILIEKGIDGREIEVSVLGNDDPDASVPGEVIPGDEFYSYRAKYIDDTSQLIIPAELDEALSDEIRGLAVRAFKALDGAGMVRADFLLERGSNRIYLNEVNTIPGFTNISMYPKLWGASGVPYPVLLDRLIALALERHEEKRQLIRRYEA
jgi:D-alanine-D-alanine ligase